MTSFEAQPETARGRAIYEMLLTVHAFIRRDLELIQALATHALDGIDPEDLRRQLDALKHDSMLWRLQVNCLRYCSFVHSHHNAEDADFFSELRETNPAINPVIDRLQAEHRHVSDDLDAVETAAKRLGHDDGQQARMAVVDSLQALRDNLLAHLEYEELNVEATVRRVREPPLPHRRRASKEAAPRGDCSLQRDRSGAQAERAASLSMIPARSSRSTTNPT